MMITGYSEHVDSVWIISKSRNQSSFNMFRSMTRTIYLGEERALARPVSLSFKL